MTIITPPHFLLRKICWKSRIIWWIIHLFISNLLELISLTHAPFRFLFIDLWCTGKRFSFLDIDFNALAPRTFKYTVLGYLESLCSSVYLSVWFICHFGRLTLSQTSPGCDKQFLLFPQCFLAVLKTFCHFHQIWNCRLQTLSIWKSKICRLGKG